MPEGGACGKAGNISLRNSKIIIFRFSISIVLATRTYEVFVRLVKMLLYQLTVMSIREDS